ncbi:hypothetical protein [Streptomyces sp. NPDC002172]
MGLGDAGARHAPADAVGPHAAHAPPIAGAHPYAVQQPSSATDTVQQTPPADTGEDDRRPAAPDEAETEAGADARTVLGSQAAGDDPTDGCPSGTGSTSATSATSATTDTGDTYAASRSAVDAVSDVASEAAVDAARDAARDAVCDVGSEAAVDAARDAVCDVGSEAAVDAARDAASERAIDPGSGTVRDVASAGAVDAVVHEPGGNGRCQAYGGRRGGRRPRLLSVGFRAA